MTRVVALIDTAQVSGPGRQLAELAVRMLDAGIELRVITFHRDGHPRSPYLRYLERAGVTHTVLFESGPLDARLLSRLRNVLSEWTPHIVQTHGYKPTALAFALRLRGARWPWIAFSHGATAENRKIKFYNWLERRLLGAADRVVVMSRERRESLARLGDKVQVLYNAAIPLPSDEQAPGEISGWTYGDTGSPLLGVVGRLSPEKGVDVFLRACGELVQRRVAFSAIVAGDGPERKNLQQLSDALGLRDHVRFVGPVATVQALYGRLDLLVIPSRSEGLPNVLLEALRADVPVAATRVGAIPEVLEGTCAGIMVRPDDPHGLADAITRALSLKNDLDSRQSRHDVTERFSPQRRVQAHIQLYDEVLGAGLAASSPHARRSAVS